MRLLFALIHSCLNPSGGAALAPRELLELLAPRGVDRRTLTAGFSITNATQSSMMYSLGSICPRKDFGLTWGVL